MAANEIVDGSVHLVYTVCMGFNKLYRRGTTNVNAKLTPLRAAVIRRLGREKSWTVLRLARHFGVSGTAVQKVLTRRTWDEVDDVAELASIEPLLGLLSSVDTSAEPSGRAERVPPPTPKGVERACTCTLTGDDVVHACAHVVCMKPWRVKHDKMEWVHKLTQEEIKILDVARETVHFRDVAMAVHKAHGGETWDW